MCLNGSAEASRTWPPILFSRSHRTTSCPRSDADRADWIPAGPAPITAIVFTDDAGVTGSYSPGLRIDCAIATPACLLACEARIASNARQHVTRSVLQKLVRKRRICEQRSGKGYEVRLVIGNQPIGFRRVVDGAGGDGRNFRSPAYRPGIYGEGLAGEIHGRDALLHHPIGAG